MIVTFNPPRIVQTEDGPVSCSTGTASIALSSTGTSISIVPIGPDGTQYRSGLVALRGRGAELGFPAFLDSVQVALQQLLVDRGI
jgi:hypothetical protein